MSTTFDLAAYYGTWYQIASIPTPFQQGCANSIAKYEPLSPNSQGQPVISVNNTCYNSSGKKIDDIEGTGTVVDANIPPKLIVQFPNIPAPPIVNYIVESTDYIHYSIVGSPDKKMLYFLSRSPWISTAQYQNMYDQAQALDYPVDQLVQDQDTVQSTWNWWIFLIIIVVFVVIIIAIKMIK